MSPQPRPQTNMMEAISQLGLPQGTLGCVKQTENSRTLFVHIWSYSFLGPSYNASCKPFVEEGGDSSVSSTSVQKQYLNPEQSRNMPEL